MQSLDITVVAGPAGGGKTTWIQQQIGSLADTTIYLNLETDAPAIDATYLAAEVPGLSVLPMIQLPTVLEHSPNGWTVYLEIGFHIDLKSIRLPDQMANYRRIAVLPPGTNQTEWHDWADGIVPGANLSFTVPHSHLWRSALSGQVLDLASLNAFWYELIHGAYGTIDRAKGIFDVNDGRSLYFDFVAGIEPTELELHLPLWLDGRPKRFSGIEVVGAAFEQAAIGQTLKDCCLEDHVIAYYQNQMRELVSDEVMS